MAGGNSFHISFAYVRPNPVAKDCFWRNCKSYADFGSGPWIIMGDFNDIATNDEQWGITMNNSMAMGRFVVAFDSCSLMDL